MRARSPALPVLLLALGGSAQAQPRLLDAAGERTPAKRAELLFATRVTKAVALPLRGVSRLVQPPGKPHPLAADPLAGKPLRGEGEQVVLAGITLVRLRFPTPAQAKVAAALLGQGARVDPRHGEWVTQARGPKAAPELLARVESVAGDAALPRDLAQTLNTTEASRRPYARTLTIPRATAGFSGVELRLEGLWVLRLRYATALQARQLVERGLSRTQRWVADQVGAELVLLGGPAVKTAARKALPAAWKAGGAPTGKRGLLGVWADTHSNRASFATLSLDNGALYQRGADILRACRPKPAGVNAAGIEWRFSDPDTRNHVLLRSRTIRPGFTRFGGVLATPSGLLHVSAGTRERREAERRTLLELLRAVGQAVPARAKTQVRLLAPTQK